MSKKTTAFKGFDKGMKCRDFQFEVGKSYEHKGSIEICSSGFHACESPFDVWIYYGPFESRFATVELLGKQKTHDGDSKIAAAKITIEAELTLPEFINKAVDWVIEKCKTSIDGERVQSSSASSAKIGSSGDYAKIGSSGYYAQIGSSGDYAQIGSSGYYAKIGSSASSAKIGSSGDYAQIGSSGYYAKIGSSGDYAQIGSSGYYAKIGSSGYSAKIDAKGESSVIASAGPKAIVSGAKGTWISVAEYDDDGKCVGFATGCIGKDGLKADVYYKAKGGKLVPNC